MNPENILAHLRTSPVHDQANTLGEVEELGNGRFVVTETTPEGETLYIVGTIDGPGFFTHWKSPSLNSDENAMFEKVKAVILPKVAAAQEADQDEFDLFYLTDFPELFPNQDLMRTLESNSAMDDGKYLKVVHAFNDLLELLGYTTFKTMGGDHKVRVKASRKDKG